MQLYYYEGTDGVEKEMRVGVEKIGSSIVSRTIYQTAVTSSSPQLHKKKTFFFFFILNFILKTHKYKQDENKTEM